MTVPPELELVKDDKKLTKLVLACWDFSEHGSRCFVMSARSAANIIEERLAIVGNRKLGILERLGILRLVKERTRGHGAVARIWKYIPTEAK